VPSRTRVEALQRVRRRIVDSQHRREAELKISREFRWGSNLLNAVTLGGARRKR
jgi:hypothetical protein